MLLVFALTDVMSLITFRQRLRQKEPPASPYGWMCFLPYAVAGRAMCQFFLFPPDYFCQ
jgi:hypothetical protein